MECAATQNLAPVVDRLDLQDDIGRRAPGLTSATFEWIVGQQNTRWNSWRSELQMLKNTAYAWRQAIFFLSFASEDQQSEAVAALRALVARHPWDGQRRFEPVIVGLDAVVGGARFDALVKLSGGRRFLGWSVGRHWLLPAPSSDIDRTT